MDPALHLFLCRPEFSRTLCEECARLDPSTRICQSGLVGSAGLPDHPLIFEHQRLPLARRIPVAHLKPIHDTTWQAIMGSLLAARHRWTLHALSLPGELQSKVEGIAQTLRRLARRLGPELEDLERPPHRAEKMDDALVLQLLLTPEGLWHSTAPMSALTSRQPGGAARMKDDPQAPSRSYLKIEEAFYRMNEWPQTGQRVVDLGAAPGGWTLAFLKRGCQVVAVDNGPLRLPDSGPGWGSVQHLRRDGLTYSLPPDTPPVDWLVADMLVPPARIKGLLENWLRGPSMKRFVINVKLPEGPPLPALREINGVLERASAFNPRIRHLYHDREEVTLMGLSDGIRSE